MGHQPSPSERLARIEALFHAALDKAPDQRDAFLDAACDDEALRREVQRLLESDAQHTGILSKPASGAGLVRPLSGGDGHRAALDRTGQQIGPYHLKRLLGAGGMGEVWFAERADEHFTMSVAIKLLKRGLDTDELLKRFRTERQVLANIEHPNIARLIDGGATEEGLPYLVMEYVDGIPLDRYCAEHALSVRERIELFRVACQSVHYAHQNLVIHRDLKPANILVTKDGQVKLLDFGIAKVLDTDGDGDHAHTEVGRHLLTPRYASPEQARGKTMTTASDVYSLGVMLYELLTGRPPYDLDTTSGKTIEQIICEEEPARPSTLPELLSARQTNGSQSNAGTGSIRRMDVARLRRELKGDLDTIILMTLRKEPERRYGSAEALSEDLRRFQSGLPVAARPDSFGYRAGKFVRRNRGVVVAASLLSMVTVTALIVISTMYVQATAAREAETQQRILAQRVTAFLTRMLASANPRQSAGEDTTFVRKLIAQASTQIDTEFKDQPQVRHDLQHILGQVYHTLGNYEDGDRLLSASLEGLIATLGPDHPKTLMVEHNLGVLRLDQGRLEEARVLLTNSLDGRRRVLGPEAPDTLASVRSLAQNQVERGDLISGESLLRESVALHRKVLGPKHPGTLVAMNDLGNLLIQRNRDSEAEAILREVLSVQREILHPDHQDLLVSQNDLAIILKRRGKFKEAETMLTEVVNAFRRTLGPSHLDTLITQNNLGDAQRRLGKVEQAASTFREVVALASEALPPDSYFTPVFRGGYARALLDLNRTEEAERQLVQCCDDLIARLGAKHPYTQRYLPDLIRLYESTNRPEAAKRYRALTGDTVP